MDVLDTGALTLEDAVAAAWAADIFATAEKAFRRPTDAAMVGCAVDDVVEVGECENDVAGGGVGVADAAAAAETAAARL